MIWTASRICASPRTKGSPFHCSTIARLDTPRPSEKRPGAAWPRVAAVIPSTIGVRVWIGSTPVAISRRVVWAAMSAITVTASVPAASPIQAVR